MTINKSKKRNKFFFSLEVEIIMIFYGLHRCNVLIRSLVIGRKPFCWIAKKWEFKEKFQIDFNRRWAIGFLSAHATEFCWFYLLSLVLLMFYLCWTRYFDAYTMSICVHMELFKPIYANDMVNNQNWNQLATIYDEEENSGSDRMMAVK